MHEVLVNRLGGLSLPRKSVVRLTDRPDMTLDVYCGRKTTIQQQLFHIENSIQSSRKSMRVYRTEFYQMIKVHLKIQDIFSRLNEFLLDISGSQTVT